MSQVSQFHYKIILSYKGTNYRGWQFQTTSPETVENYVRKVLVTIANYEKFQLMAASRTDSGVHALGQVLKVTLPRQIEACKLASGMNSKLPSDIKVRSCKPCKKSFNPNKDPISKEYNYFFIPKSIKCPTLLETCYYISYDLNISLMKKACTLMTGKHDFFHYCSKTEGISQTIREITYCKIEKTSFLPFEPEVFFLKIEAQGFLKYMVRFIMNALIEVGKENITLAQFRDSLNRNQSSFQKKKAPAHALHLIKVNYDFIPKESEATA